MLLVEAGRAISVISGLHAKLCIVGLLRMPVPIASFPKAWFRWDSSADDSSRSSIVGEFTSSKNPQSSALSGVVVVERPFCVYVELGRGLFGMELQRLNAKMCASFSTSVTDDGELVAGSFTCPGLLRILVLVISLRQNDGGGAHEETSAIFPLTRN